MSSLVEPRDFVALLQEALRHGGGTHDLGDVLKMIDDGQAQFWHSPETDSCVVTEIMDYPLKRVLRLSLGAGEFKASLPTLYYPLLDWGRKQGCVEAQIWGRPGWERVLPGPWKRTMVVCARSLKED